MSYESIAKLVHDLVKNPKDIMSRELMTSPELKTDEFAIIKKVFSDYEVSGGAVAFDTLPLGLWG